MMKEMAKRGYLVDINIFNTVLISTTLENHSIMNVFYEYMQNLLEYIQEQVHAVVFSSYQ